MAHFLRGAEHFRGVARFLRGAARFTRVRRESLRRLSASGAIGLVILLTGCSSLVSIPVDDFSVPADATHGEACFQRVEAESALSGVIGTAAFLADATYARGLSIGPSEIQIKLYGRTSAPEDTCIAEGAPGNIVLSRDITLAAGEATPVEVGGDEFGDELADVVTAGTFWIGGAVQNESFGLGDTVRFENGRITLGF